MPHTSQIVTDVFERLASIKKEAFLSASECAKKNKLSRSFMNFLLVRGRVTGAYKSGNIWIIPKAWRYKKKRKGRKHGPRPKPTLALDDPSRVG